jgi:hypothetical protein
MHDDGSVIPGIAHVCRLGLASALLSGLSAQCFRFLLVHRVIFSIVVTSRPCSSIDFATWWSSHAGSIQNFPSASLQRSWATSIPGRPACFPMRTRSKYGASI